MEDLDDGRKGALSRVASDAENDCGLNRFHSQALHLTQIAGA